MRWRPRVRRKIKRSWIAFAGPRESNVLCRIRRTLRLEPVVVGRARHLSNEHAMEWIIRNGRQILRARSVGRADGPLGESLPSGGGFALTSSTTSRYSDWIIHAPLHSCRPLVSVRAGQCGLFNGSYRASLLFEAGLNGYSLFAGACDEGREELNRAAGPFIHVRTPVDNSSTTILARQQPGRTIFLLL